MPIKSTQTDVYETACFIQEAPQSSELTPRGYVLKRAINGNPYVVFPSTLWTFECSNRMGRRYDENNVRIVIGSDERIQTLKKLNKWRGELNHPNPELENTRLSSIRMTIPEQMRTSHFISKDYFENHRYRATITTHPTTECGLSATSEIVDIGAVPSFSVRLLGSMRPSAGPTQPNMDVRKVITFDMVDFPSHHDANADIVPAVQEATVIYLKDLAAYCKDQSEDIQVVCESFQMTPAELIGIGSSEPQIVLEHADSSRVIIPLKGNIKREAIDILRKIGI